MMHLMNNIFAIRKDAPKYKMLDLDILDVTRNLPDNIDLDSVYDFSQLNTAMASWWVTPDTRYTDYAGEGESSVPDISCWIDATLVLSPKSHRLLKDLLNDSGEFLPVLVAGELHYIFNCFVLGEPNEDACEFNREEGMQAGLKHLEFDQSVTKHIIFKATFEGCLTLFCNQRFKDIVTSFDLHGIFFDKDLIIA